MNSKWKNLVPKVLDNKKRTSEKWKDFTDDQIEFLFDLESSEISYEDIKEKHDLKDVMRNGSRSFTLECFSAIIRKGKENIDDKFFSLFSKVNEQISKGKIKDKTLKTDKILETALLELVEIEDSDSLKLILNKLSKHNNFLKDNNAALISACRKNQLELVLPFVSVGYRLSTKQHENMDMMNRTQELREYLFTSLNQLWSSLIRPIYDNWKSNGDNVENASNEKYDEINELNILRLMVTPSYIFSRYRAILDMNSKQKSSECSCVSNSTRRTGVMNEMQFHLCPDNGNFVPFSNCRQHLECNDPIYTCIDLACLGRTLAKRKPEFAEEYEGIVQQAKDLSVQLLDQCSSTNDVETLLEEDSGSRKYFNFSNKGASISSGEEMRYPRLKLAIELHHREFVGHMYCQQMLKREWYCNRTWAGTSNLYKAYYSFIQLILLPLNVLIALFVGYYREYYKLQTYRQRLKSLSLENASGKTKINRDSRKINKKDDGIIHSVGKTLFNFGQTLNDSGKFNQDVPLNRFIAFSWTYLFFLLILVMYLLLHEVLAENHEFENWNSAGEILLTLYICSFILQDIYTIMVHKSNFLSSFWRVYDYIWHLLLFCSWLTKNSENNYFTRDPFVVGATLALARMIYWFQLSGRIGPIVLNMARVLPDIITVVITFLVVLFSFGIGVFYFVISPSNDGDVQQMNATIHHHKIYFLRNIEQNYPNYTQWSVVFGKVLENMAWTILNPGPSDFTDISGRTVEILFAVYQCIIVVILLNLLIVMMNTTVQRLQDKKHLYWKFARTSIWLEFMKDGVVLPPPFLLLSLTLTVVLRIIGGMIKAAWWISRKWSGQSVNGVLDLVKGKANVDSKSTKKSCKIDPIEAKRRKKHEKLMETLINRFMNEEKVDDESQASSTHRKIVDSINGKVEPTKLKFSNLKDFETIA